MDCTKRVKWVRADRQWRTWRRPRKHVHQSFKHPRAEDYIGTWYWSICRSRALSRTTQLVRVSCTAPTSPFENCKATKLVKAERHRSSLIRAMIFLVETCAKRSCMSLLGNHAYQQPLAARASLDWLYRLSVESFRLRLYRSQRRNQHLPLA